MPACLTLEPKKSNPKKYFLNGIGTKKHVYTQKPFFNIFVILHKNLTYIGSDIGQKGHFFEKKVNLDN